MKIKTEVDAYIRSIIINPNIGQTPSGDNLGDVNILYSVSARNFGMAEDNGSLHFVLNKKEIETIVKVFEKRLGSVLKL